jgi:hypothetical protein
MKSIRGCSNLAFFDFLPHVLYGESLLCEGVKPLFAFVDVYWCDLRERLLSILLRTLTPTRHIPL